MKLLTYVAATNKVTRMTIDERLEAITRNLELLASLQQAHERRISSLEDRQGELTAAMTKLAGYVFDHEERIGELERH